MRGNRDFLLGEKFTCHNGIHLLEDKTIILLYGKPTLLMHGDLLCTNDRAYQYYRKIMFSPWVKKICLSLPLNLRRAMAKKLRSISEYSQRLKKKAIDTIPQESVIQALENTHTTLLIHGHIHQAGEYDIPLTHQIGKRLVLGAWDSQQGNAIIASENKPPRLISFKEAIELTN
ncbi:MAG: UDP-2,3-diacylglucosamine diphosphatase [Gammaproteobacteria bacterium]|nr:UDP-2,3-diacylglucosamine diphosphatase [Gammaproteobacteria bacterium]